MDSGAERARDSAPPALGDPLTARDEAILVFERQWWRHAGAKEEAIRMEFGLSTARYYQVLNTVLELPAALAFDPMLVKRLQRIRDARTAARSARAFGSADANHDHTND